MKLLYVMRNISGGGNSKRFWSLHKLLVKKGVDTTLLTSEAGVGQNIESSSICSENIDVLLLKLPNSKISNYYFYIKAADVISKIKKNFDFIHDDFSPIAPYSFLFHHYTIATVHEVFGKTALKRYGISGMLPVLNETLYNKMKYKTYISCSSSMSKELNKLGVNNELIPLGIDPNIYTPLSYDSKDKNTIVILMVSRFVSIKGHIFFIEIAKELYKKYKNIKFILPSTGPLLPEIKKLSQRLKLPIFFPGFIQNEQDIIKIYQASDIYVHTSLQEGFGISVCEAMACQLPIVAFKVPGVIDLVTHECGYLISPRDIKDAVNKISILIEDDSLRYNLGKNARKRVLKNYTWEISANKLYDVYKKIQ